MGAVGGGEGVVDIDVAELGEFVDMGRIVLLLALVKAGVLEEKHVAVLHFGDRIVGRLADAVGREGDRPLDDVGDRGGDGLERIGFIRAALGPAEMGEKNDLAAFVRDLRDRRRHPLDARRIGHAAVLRRNVEIDAQQHALAGDIDVIERAERCGHAAPLEASRGSDAVSTPSTSGHARVKRACSPAAPGRAGLRDRSWAPLSTGATLNPQISFAIATAVSAMRFEKPHSLSYQESTRTKSPSMTLV